MFYLILVVFIPLLAFLFCVSPFYSGIRESKRYFLLIAVWTMLFLNHLWVGSNTLVQMDALILQIPFLSNYRDSILLYGQLPLWNPYLWSGIASLAHPLSYVFHPTVFLFLLLPVYTAFNLTLLLMFFFSASFMFILMRELNQKHSVALISSVVYAFNEWTIQKIASPQSPGAEYIYSYAIIPLSLALLIRALKTRQYFYGIPFGLSLVFVMNGNPSMCYYGILLSAIFLVCPTIPSVNRKTILGIDILILGLAVFLLVDSIELLPFLEFQENASGTRLTQDVSRFRMREISWTQLPVLFLPSEKSPYFGYASKAGWIALSLTLLSLTRLKNDDGRTIILMVMLLFFGILLVTHSPLFSLMYDYLPLFRKISMIPAVFIFFTLPLSVLSGLGSKVLLTKRPRVAILVVLLIFVEIFLSYNGFMPYSKLPKITSLDVGELYDFPHLAYLNPDRILDSYRIACKTGDYKMLCPDYAVAGYRLRLINGERYAYPAKNIRNLLDSNLLSEQSKEKLLDVKYILSTRELDEPGFILKHKLYWDGFDKHNEGSVSDPVELSKKTGWNGTVYIYEAVWSEHAFILDTQLSLTGSYRMDFEYDPNSNMSALWTPLLDAREASLSEKYSTKGSYALNLTAVLSENKGAARWINRREYSVRGLEDQNILVDVYVEDVECVRDRKLRYHLGNLIKEFTLSPGWNNLSANLSEFIPYREVINWSRVFNYQAIEYSVDCNTSLYIDNVRITEREYAKPKNTFKVTYFSPTRIELEGSTSKKGVLFVSEPYYPGWEVLVDGVNSNLRNVEGFMGVDLNEGPHSVVLCYDPLSFKLGFWITVISFSFTSIFYLRHRRSFLCS